MNSASPATWTSYQVSWLFPFFASSSPWLLVVSQRRYAVIQACRLFASASFHAVDLEINTTPSSMSGRARVSMMPMPRPSLIPGIP